MMSDLEDPSAPAESTDQSTDQSTVQVDPQDFQSFKAEVTQQFEQSDFEAAMARLEKAAVQPDSSRYLDQNIWLYQQLGHLYEAFERRDDALAAYKLAYEFDPRNLDVLEPYADMLVAGGTDEHLAGVLRAMLVHHKPQLGADKQVWIYRHLGAYYEACDELERARHSFEKALQAAPEDQRALTGLLRVVGAVGEPADVIEVRRKLIKSLDDTRARSMALVAMGNDWRQQFDDPWRALDIYEEALAEDAQNTHALESIVEVGRQIGDWRRVSRGYFTLHRLAESPEEKADWLIESSKVARQELWEPEKALAGFRQALELDPTRLDAFKVVTSLLVDAKDWAALEAAYLQLIAANQDLDAPDETLLAVLWEKLGELYWNHLDQPTQALTAYDRASEMMPANVELHDKVAELAESKPDYADLAISHLKALADLAPERLSTFDRLGRVYLRQKQVDPAFCHLRAYQFMGGKLADNARDFVDRLSSPMAAIPERQLTMDLLQRLVFHRDMNPDISRVFGIIKPALLQWVGEKRSKYGLRRRDRVKLKEQLAFNNLYKQIGASLGYQDLPNLWRKPDQRGLINGALVPEGMIVGDDLLGSGREKHIAFLVGKQLFLFLAPFYLAAIRPLTDLHAFFLLAAALVKPELDFDKDKHSQHAFKALRKRVKGDDRDRLDHAVGRVMASGDDIDVGTWLETVEDTANRVGLIYCDDLDVAADYLGDETQTIGTRSADARIQALVDYAVSDRYQTLRNQLGLSVS